MFELEVESKTQHSGLRTQKKIRGQGQVPTFRGQTPSSPRTETLEAKSKDHGSAVATRGPGGHGPLAIACAPSFWFTQITVFGTSPNNNDGKSSSYVQA